MKRIPSVATGLLFSIVVNAHTFQSGGIYYDLTSSYAIVTYYGSDNNSRYYSGDVTIPETVTYQGNTYPVTKIGEYAFYGCGDITSVTIPPSVKEIGQYAFYYAGQSGWNVNISDLGAWCRISYTGDSESGNPRGYQLVLNGETITDLVIPDGVTSICKYAFSSCRSLTSITIPQSVTSIGSDAFAYCQGLTSVTIPVGVSMGTDVFYHDNSLTTVTIPEGVTNIASGTFGYCNNVTDVYCYAMEPPYVMSDYGTPLFGSDNTKYNLTLHVPYHALEAYRTARIWKKCTNIVPIETILPEWTLIDSETYSGELAGLYIIESLHYVRKFSNTNWQALYVPFRMEYSDWNSQFDAARINNIHQYDDNDDGKIDRSVLEVILLPEGSHIAANTPYLIRAKGPLVKDDGEDYETRALTLTYASLSPADEKVFTTMSWNEIYTFKGNYSAISAATMSSSGYYAMGGGALIQSDGSNALGSYRWYMKVTDRDGVPKEIGEVKIMVLDEWGIEEETDGIEAIQNSKFKIQNENAVYDLSGRKLSNCQIKKGLYIRNGRKVLVRQ